MAPKKKKKNTLCSSALYYRTHTKARAKKKLTDNKVNKRPSQLAKRRELGRKNYSADKRGVNRKGMDFDHAIGRYVSSKTNRGRRGEGGRKKKGSR